MVRRTAPSGFFKNAPRHTSWVVGVLAAISLISSLSVQFRRLTEVPRTYVDNYIVVAPDTSFAWAFVLALLAFALASRKRIAWWLTVVYILLFGTANVIYLFEPFASENGVDTVVRVNIFIGLAIQLLALGYLIASYRQFYTKVRRGAIWRALGVLVAGLVAASLIGWGLVEIWPRDLKQSERLPYAINHVVTFGSIDVSTDFDNHHTYAALETFLGLLGALALIAAALILFRSQRSSNSMTPADERLIRLLIEGYSGDDSLAFFSTRHDKAVVFAPNGMAAITYRVEVGTAMAGGDPVGDKKYWPDAVAEFIKVCDQYGWHPGAIGVSIHGAEVWEAAGFTTLNIGDEAIVHTRGYNLNGPDMKAVRQSVARTKRAGITVRIARHEDLSEEQMAAMIGRADAWRDTDEERGFSMALGRLGDPQDGRSILVEAVQNAGTDDEKVVGMLSFVPWGTTGASLDVMRRDHNSINGLTETMVTEFAENAEAFGILYISMNFAAFRAVFEEGGQIGAGPIMRTMYGALTFASKYVQMESLYKSNAKYQPEWVPRFLCFEDARTVPRVGLAAVVNEGFVKLPKFGKGRDFTGQASSIPEGVDVDAVAAEIAGMEKAEHRGPRRPEQVRVRLAKLEQLTAAGVDPYPPAYPPTHTIAEAVAAPEGTTGRIAGRVIRMRDFGKVVFCDVRDWSGDMQVLVDASALRPETLDLASTVDLGDLIEVSGVVGRSRKGELSLLAKDWRMLGKCLHPLPDKWSGLTDPEARVRQRYVDLTINPKARELMRVHSAIVKSMRDYLGGRDYMEVETPILQQIHGGANAAPFRTHINAYDLDLYLRIAPELYLKRLCVGGLERVFEMGRNFRNEGVDFKHNPEFTSLEAYEAHSDYDRMLHLTREMIQNAAVAAHGEQVVYIEGKDGVIEKVDISGEWPVKTLHGAVSEAIDEDITPYTDVDTLKALCDKHEIPYRNDWDAGQVALEMYEHLVEDQTTFPTFYKDFPTSVSPLTRQHRTIPGVTERWDLVAWGVELGTAYTELTDPVEQRKRLTEQSLLAAGGDPEAMELDEDFLQALEHGMFPTGGLGIGVDRIVMLLTGQSIRETLAFPLAKPK
ncbi:bifunctional lysylphosphatidylglycerol synthetase/lysine--tRNA ligase LysX [Gordonia rubripertincta]|uniref:Lysine--tRNA ligase n=1 Tax=Gordonia rubripertincta TaxID=36822 RepID=A0ABT4MR27_GORRU|nr:bifunctional lysylphosphatidylglycerol synthetase/lysine--tRNA ligase LysX [Gordonia rubripertincta]MCZ4549458.1 bifunctional lysylphosphatidylglycerol synthetase/lysine--tRNA ligase LysX [Gordonia rubripertincta]